MKKLLVLLLITTVLVHAQGEQLYADGTATDQDGNSFEWINYGTQDWAIENAEVETYRDGTPIPQVTDATEWENLTTGAWCYYDNDPTKGKLYNMFAVLGIHDNNQQTPAKVFAPIGWQVPTIGNWDDLIDHVSATYSILSIGQSLASTSGWMDLGDSFTYESIGINQETNNISGFNMYPFGQRLKNSNSSEPIKFYHFSFGAYFWTSSRVLSIGFDIIYFTTLGGEALLAGRLPMNGFSVRFVRDAQTASTKDYSKPAAIYPNPTTSIITIEGDAIYDIEVYSLQGRKLMTHKGNSIDLSVLSNAMYLIKATNTANKQQQIYKVIKE